jgi:hypothetical protein
MCVLVAAPGEQRRRWSNYGCYSNCACQSNGGVGATTGVTATVRVRATVGVRANVDVRATVGGKCNHNLVFHVAWHSTGPAHDRVRNVVRTGDPPTIHDACKFTCVRWSCSIPTGGL